MNWKPKPKRQALWLQVFKPKTETIRATELETEYRRISRIFKIDHPKCQACQNRKTNDIHHTRGKLGELLIDWRYFLAVCRTCHNWIGCNIEAARTRGWICERGLWNVADETPIPEYKCRNNRSQ